MLYAADLFLIPDSCCCKGTKGHIGRLWKIQRQASLHIAGAMKSIPTDIIDACADLLPFHHLVDKLVHRAVVRLAALPQAHPLTRHVSKAVGRYVKRHRAMLHEVTHAFGIRPGDFEVVNPVRHGPKWRP